MDHEQSRLTLPIALASLQLSFHCTTALFQHGLLTPAKRLECAKALDELLLDLENLAMDEGQAFAMLAGLRDLIDHLQARP